MNVLETDRLILRWLTVEDAEFIFELVNEPAWLQFIGDRGVRTLADARDYILRGPLDMYNRLGFGLYAVVLKESGIPIGMCGLLKRATLQDVDIGFAFLARFRGQGYGYESAAAVLEYGKNVLGLPRIVAITMPDNVNSIQLLEKLGLRFEGMVRLSEHEPALNFFTSDG
ncbi:MAG: GNAT family N-acetyltransferase [Chloroflexi bacterium]|nr:GNAT family N-acetyltransferase [Chloroflexota bacterium]